MLRRIACEIKEFLQICLMSVSKPIFRTIHNRHAASKKGAKSLGSNDKLRLRPRANSWPKPDQPVDNLSSSAGTKVTSGNPAFLFFGFCIAYHRVRHRQAARSTDNGWSPYAGRTIWFAGRSMTSG